MEPTPTGERPFLVLTKRRTGGTSLMRLMARASSFPSVQHEPFNGRRIWGGVVRAFRETRDEAALGRALETCLADRPNIKHCYEFLPPQLTLALIDACAARGYAVFHLVRRDEVSRLRSLGLALVTDAWGSRKAAEVHARLEAGEMVLGPVDLDLIRKRFVRDRRQQANIDAYLRAGGIDAMPVVYEDLYRDDGGQAERAARVVAHMGAALTPGDPFLKRFLDGKGQNSASAMKYLPNRAAFETLLEELRAVQAAQSTAVTPISTAR